MKQKPDGWIVIRGKRQKIFSIYKNRWEADYYGRSTLPFTRYATYSIAPVKIVFLDEEEK